MSDAPQGPGWWQASDGHWYPPQNPTAQVPVATGPGPGWWQASDGQWYPPEQRPGWWQASDGQWYPPEQRQQQAAPAPAAAPARTATATAVAVAAPADPPHDPTVDDPELARLLREHVAAWAAIDEADAIQVRIDGLVQRFGFTETAEVAGLPPSGDPLRDLRSALSEAEAEAGRYDQLASQRATHEHALRIAQQKEQELKKKVIIAAVIGAVVLVLLILVLFA